MKIAVIGSYNGTSIGDTAILLGLLHGIAQADPQAQVTVLTAGPIDLARDVALTGLIHAPCLVRANVHAPAEWPVLRSLWWRLQRLGLPLGTAFNFTRVRRVLQGQDLLLIGGGNLLMDLFPAGVDRIENMTAAARDAHCHFSFVGVGAGPVTQDSSARRLAACLTPAQRVVVRDVVSQTLCKETLDRADTECAPDLAFALPVRSGTAERTVLAVNVAAVGALTWPVQDAQQYRQYLDGMARLVLDAVDQINPRQIEIVTTNPAVDLVAAQDLTARLAGRTPVPVVQLALRDVTDILDAFGRARLAIVTRLHAGITAALAGTPVLPVAYQPKVKDVLCDAGIAPLAIALDALCDPDHDTRPALTQAIAHGARLRPDLRAQSLAALQRLLQAHEPCGAPA